jgi:hypothetical protein
LKVGDEKIERIKEDGLRTYGSMSFCMGNYIDE